MLLLDERVVKMRILHHHFKKKQTEKGRRTQAEKQGERGGTDGGWDPWVEAQRNTPCHLRLSAK